MTTHSSIERATAISREVLRAYADDVDRSNRFPAESVQALRDAGLLGLMLPAKRGGAGGSLRELAGVSAALGEECLSTALVWAMHSQQLAILGEHAEESQSTLLQAAARDGVLIASVTTEPGLGADLWQSASPVIREKDRLHVVRTAPVVSYGEQAGLFLIKMRSHEARPPTDVVMVLVKREEATLRVTGDWNAMGMRGTCSVPMQIEATVDASCLVGQDYRAMAMETMVPFGYIGWSAAWFGAARGRLNAWVRHLRDGSGRRGRTLNSDLLKHRIARLRLALDLVEAMLDRVVEDCEHLRTAGPQAFDQHRREAHLIRMNNLKVASSEMAHDVVNALLEMAGMRQGYLRDGELGLERVLRDIRSASLMYHNDPLLAANANLMLMEGTALSPAARQPTVAAGI